MWDFLKTLGTWGIVLELFIIMFFKIIEVSVGTIRGILVVKGYRKFASLLAIIEILLWVFIASRVITGLADDPFKGIAYSIGFAAGVYLGSYFEQKLAFGFRNVQIFAKEDEAPLVASLLRNHGYGVTTIDGEGRAEKRKIMTIFATRHDSNKINTLVEEVSPDALVIISDIISLKGGYYTKRRKFIK